MNQWRQYRLYAPACFFTLMVSCLSLYAGELDQPRTAAQEAVVEFDFTKLMQRVSQGWTKQDTELALSAFNNDALYTEPPDLQIYRGHGELRNFFNAVRPGSSMIWHNLWYHPETGMGAGEYSFHNGGRTTAAHGVVVVMVKQGKISLWREYQRRGEISFDAFLNPDTKNWKWTGEDFEKASPPQGKVGQPIRYWR